MGSVKNPLGLCAPKGHPFIQQRAQPWTTAVPHLVHRANGPTTLLRMVGPLGRKGANRVGSTYQGRPGDTGSPPSLGKQMALWPDNFPPTTKTLTRRGLWCCCDNPSRASHPSNLSKSTQTNAYDRTQKSWTIAYSRRGGKRGRDAKIPRNMAINATAKRPGVRNCRQ